MWSKVAEFNSLKLRQVLLPLLRGDKYDMNLVCDLFTSI